MLREIRALGFEWAELSHGIRVSLLPGIMDAVDAGEIKISSLHNFCPLPMGVNHAAPNLYLFSSEDRRERESAFKHTVKTIETAARLKAAVVVVHLGRIDMKDFTPKLLEMLEEGKKDTSKYTDLCETVAEKLEKKKKTHMELITEMLDRLTTVATEHGLTLGIENRQALEELPLDADLDLLTLEYDRRGAGYWHDCGHAQIKENLGFINHRMHLESLASRLLGLHVHDVIYPGRDHHAPGTGTIDYAALKPSLTEEHIKVFELSPHLPVEEVTQGIAHIQQIWGPV